MATLIVLGPPAAGLRHIVQPHRHAVLGRDPSCDLVLNKRSVSRFHAQVITDRGDFFLEDNRSTNGTYVNGKRIDSRVVLRDGDRIVIHDIPVAFFLSDQVSPAEEETLQLRDALAEIQKTVPELSNASASGALAIKGRFQTLLEITRHIGSSLDLTEILPRVLDLLFRMFPQAIVGEIHLVDDAGRLRPVAMKHGREADSTDLTGAPFNLELISSVFETGKSHIRTECPEDPRLALDEFCQSTICAPILDPASDPFGVILLETDDASHMFGDDDLELVSAIAVLAGQAIGYSRAHEIVLQHHNTVRQLETARQIQLGMLPRELPDVPGYRFCHHYAAAEKVGGDFFFYEKMRDGRVILGIADASGKGLPAAMNIVRFAGEVRLRIATSPTLKAAVASLNDYVIGGADDCTFITTCICVLDPRQHLMAIANAGHPPPLLKRRETPGLESLVGNRRSFPLGITHDFELHPLIVPVLPGDQIVLFTDGVSEAMNPRSEIYGFDRLANIAAAGDSIGAIIDAIVTDVSSFREGRDPSDDMTIVGLERLAG
jgi:serine phosphatase RsbU (regulator of sigma subunit)